MEDHRRLSLRAVTCHENATDPKKTLRQRQPDKLSGTIRNSPSRTIRPPRGRDEPARNRKDQRHDHAKQDRRDTFRDGPRPGTRPVPPGEDTGRGILQSACGSRPEPAPDNRANGAAGRTRGSNKDLHGGSGLLHGGDRRQDGCGTGNPEPEARGSRVRTVGTQRGRAEVTGTVGPDPSWRESASDGGDRGPRRREAAPIGGNRSTSRREKDGREAGPGLRGKLRGEWAETSGASWASRQVSGTPR